MNKELQAIQNHVNKYQDVWWNILSRHIDGIYIVWGKNDRQ